MNIYHKNKQLIDQLAHIVAAAIAISIATFLGAGIGMLPGAALWFSMGLIREVAQHNTFRIWALGSGSNLDILCWTIGGAITGGLL